MNSPEKTPQTDAEVENSLYVKRKKIYPREVHGIFAQLRVLGIISLLGFFYGMPWLQWSGRQAILFDLPNRQFHILGVTFWPQDFFYLAVLLVIAALSLFFFTALAGRLWCGYACPQTVWTEMFLWIERKIEGSRPSQIRLDKSDWNAEKWRKKGLKHGAWLVLSLFTGLTFVGFFTPIRDLFYHIVNLSLGPWETFWVLFYGFATYGNAGWLREQVCIYMCPYARFQGAMIDSDTFIIAYDEKRGDPKGSRRKSEAPREIGLGDCIDCSICVQVCPTGIDIREGLQYECIGCAACIDACDDVMRQMDYPTGLIRYTTQHALEGKPIHFLRPRTVIYAGILLLTSILLMVSISNRIPLEVDIIRDRNSLYRETDEGIIENVYVLNVINMDEKDHTFRVEVSGMESLRIGDNLHRIFVKSGSVASMPLRLEIDPEYLKRSHAKIEFTVTAIDNADITLSQPSQFLGPL